MTDSQATIDRLEARVSDLSEALALAQKQAARQATQLQVSQELTQLFTTTPEVPSLVKQITEIIKNGFSFYSAAIFLIDPTGYAVLHHISTGSSQPHTANEARPLINQIIKTKQPVIVSPGENDHKTNSLPQPAMALPLLSDEQLTGILYLENATDTPFEQADVDFLQPLAGPIAAAIIKTQHHTQAITERDKSKLLYEFSAALGTTHDFEAIIEIAVSFANRWGAITGNIHLLSDTGEVYFKSSYKERNNLGNFEKQELVRQILTEGLEAWVLETGRSVLIPDTKLDERWLPIQYPYQAHDSRSIICSPIILERGFMRGAISFVHSETNYFNQQDLAMLDALAAQIGVALENTILFKDIETNLYESQLVAEISSRLVGATAVEQIYSALIEGMMKTGINRCVVYTSDDVSDDNLPRFSETVLASDVDPDLENSDQNPPLILTDYPALARLVETRQLLLISNLDTQPDLTDMDRQFLGAFKIKSTAVIPLVLRERVTGLLFAQYRSPHIFDQHELTLYQMLCNQTVAAIENARQREQIHLALTETQILYRAGRVLAGTTNLADILREALIDFLYGLGLDQGGITLLTPDRKYGELVAYVQDGQVEEVQRYKFEIDENIPYQQLLLSGYPFTSYDVASDPRLKAYQNFNSEKAVKSLLEAPMIANGETIGWIGADAVDEHRVFSQREIDLVRAMADQISITIQNHQLLKKSERQAEQLKAVAQVGHRVSQLIDLDDILRSTVDLIRDRFGFYHVSIFLLDETKKWAVVRASTGEVGKIMVERPHRLEVGGQSIVGYVTGCAEPRIALDVGEDAVHFNNPLLPDTHSEMALPLIAGGQVIGALDVQSVKVNAFAEEDIETLQIMADQLTAALENARLLKSAQESETFLKAVINQIPDPIFIKNREHQWVVANRAFADEVLDLPEEKIIGYSDYDYLDKEEADWFWEQDDKVFQTGQPNETEEAVTDVKGGQHILFTRKIPLFIQDNSQSPDYLIGIINDITERKQREVEREELLEEIRRNLERTQSLYRVSQVLTTATTPQTAFESVLGEYLQLLKLKQGSLMLLDSTNNYIKAQARYINGKPVEPKFISLAQEDLAFQRLAQSPKPLLIEDAQNHPLIKDSTDTRAQSRVKSMLFIPLTIQGKVAGSLVADAVGTSRTFSQDDIEMGEAIASQLSVRLESLQFLTEAQYKSNLLQTAAEVSRASSSILDTDQLINDSVNLIRDQFQLYYVGLFLVDDQKKWAMLRAGTGEAGRLQVEAGHKLEIGGGSMIGASLQNREPRISMEVGEEREFFRNKYLPDTRSELALPLISQGQAIGALTVQSIEPNAFSTEDITVLQTMADQLANAIQNARLFEQAQQEIVERRRAEQQVLQRNNELAMLNRVTQAVSSMLDLEDMTQVIVREIVEIFRDRAQGIACAINLFNSERTALTFIAEYPLLPDRPSLVGMNIPTENDSLRQNVESGEPIIIEKRENDFPAQPIFELMNLRGAECVMLVPFRGKGQVIGIIALDSTQPGWRFSEADMEFVETIAGQLAGAIENARLFESVAQARQDAEEHLRETVALQSFSQALASTRHINEILDFFFATCTKTIGFDYVQVSLIDRNRRVKAIAGVGVSEQQLRMANKSLDSSDIMADIIRTGKTEVITGWDDRFDRVLFELEEHQEWVRLFTPITLRQNRVGLVEAGFNTGKQATIDEEQIRLLQAFIDQTVLALDNAQRHEVSQRAAQREAIIREITGKIQGAVDIDDILKTTVAELSQILDTSRASVRLAIAQPEAKPSPSNGQATSQSTQYSTKVVLPGKMPSNEGELPDNR